MKVFGLDEKLQPTDEQIDIMIAHAEKANDDNDTPPWIYTGSDKHGSISDPHGGNLIETDFNDGDSYLPNVNLSSDEMRHIANMDPQMGLSILLELREARRLLTKTSIVVLPEDDGSGYTAVLPGMPGAMTCADTWEDLHMMIEDVKKCWKGEPCEHHVCMVKEKK